MPKGDVLITLIKEVVRNEVKQQVKEELEKLLKSGKIKFTETKKEVSTPKTQVGGGARVVTNTGLGKGGLNLSDIPYNAVYEYDTEMYPNVPKVKKEYTKNTALNEILNETKPFTSAERATGPSPMVGMTGGSVLDSIQRDSDEDWGTIRMNTSKMSKSTPNMAQPMEGADAVTKALTRDYSELVKRFK